MGRLALTSSFPWAKYSKKLAAKIDSPRSVGMFTPEDAAARGMHLAVGAAGDVEEGNGVEFYWFVDSADGKIVDARFQAFGQSALIGAAETLCEIVVGKNYDQARRINADLIDKSLRDKNDVPAFPQETLDHLKLVVKAVEAASEKCMEIPLPEAYVAPPVPRNFVSGETGIYPGWDELTVKQKISVIEEVIAQDIRPYVELDAGGVEVLNLVDNREVVIRYQGACTTCFSSTGATLSAIQQILRAKVHPSLEVVPDFGGK